MKQQKVSFWGIFLTIALILAGLVAIVSALRMEECAFFCMRRRFNGLCLVPH